MLDLIDSFFSFKQEEEFNQRLDKGDGSDSKHVLGYVHELLDCPITFFLQHIREDDFIATLQASDMLVFSSIDDALINVPTALSKISTANGITALELGEQLQQDGNKHNEGSYRKYGEQQGKLALAFGLARRMNKRFLPSALGMIAEKLNEAELMRLRERVILRTREMQYVIHQCSLGKVDLRNILSSAPSMYLRQRVSFNALKRALDESTEFNYVFLEKELNIN